MANRPCNHSGKRRASLSSRPSKSGNCRIVLIPALCTAELLVRLIKGWSFAGMEEHDRIIALLKNKGPLSSEVIEEALGISPSRLSEHLETLTRERVVNNGRKGYWVPYTSTINPQTQVNPNLYDENHNSTVSFDSSKFHHEYKDDITRTFCDHGTTRFGSWKAETTYSPAKWEPNLPLRVK